MRKYNAWSVPLLLIAILIMSCGDRVQLNDQQKQGKKIYEGLCDKCHQLISPAAHTDVEWQQAVNRYGVKLKLTRPELDAIIAYLTIANDSL